MVLPATTFAADKADEQAEVRQAAQSALDALYKVQPAARKSVESAAGYAAFSNFGMKILVAGGGSGKGIAVSNKTKATTYMKMAEPGWLGSGSRNSSWSGCSRTSRQQQVVTRWSWARKRPLRRRQAGASRVPRRGGRVTGVWLYQLTGDSLALELTAKGKVPLGQRPQLTGRAARRSAN
jgi:hypothetical protein